MTTEQMLYFVTMAETLSFTKTAEKLYITQPTLSRHIRRIEEELGLALFIRDGTVVTITPAGEKLYEGLKHIYRQYVDLTETTRKMYNNRPTFRIALGEEQLMDDMVQLAINLFRARHQDVDLSIHRTNYRDLLVGIKEGRYDVADTIIGPELYKDLNITFLSLGEEEAYLAMAKELRAHFPEKLTRADFKAYVTGYRILFPDEDNFYVGKTRYKGPASIFMLEQATDGFAPEVHTVGSPVSVPVQVTSGLGLTICNRSNLFTVDPAAAVVEIEGYRPFQKVLFYQENSPNPLVNDFLTIVQEKIAERDSAGTSE